MLALWLSGKEPTCQFKRHRFDPWLGRSPGGDKGNPLQGSCLANLIEPGGLQSMESQKMQTQLSGYTTAIGFTLPLK